MGKKQAMLRGEGWLVGFLARFFSREMLVEDFLA